MQVEDLSGIEKVAAVRIGYEWWIVSDFLIGGSEWEEGNWGMVPRVLMTLGVEGG